MNGDILENDMASIRIPHPLVRDLRGIYTLWLRDVIRLWRDKVRLVGSLIQPLLFCLFWAEVCVAVSPEEWLGRPIISSLYSPEYWP